MSDATDRAPSGGEAHPPKFPRDGVEFNRIINLTDAVAAIALTILVLTLDVPTTTGDAATADMGEILDGLWPSVFAFLLSFAIIASSWYKHHRFVARLGGLDGAMVVWNFVWLLALVLVPFASDLIGTYGANPSGVALYAAMMGALYLIGLAGYQVARFRELLTEELTAAQRRARLYDDAVPAACFLGSIPATLVTGSTSVGYYLWIAIWPLSSVTGHHRGRVDAAAALGT